MSQHDLDIANQGFPATRADINNALQALGSSNSGATAPSTTYANQLWYDTANNIIKIRNEDNDAWISLFTLDQTNDNIEALTIDGSLTVDGGSIKLDGNYPTGSSNVALGNAALDDGSLSGANNTAIGSSAMTANTSGAANTTCGSLALDANTTGDNNSAFGVNALSTNTTADNNSAFGYQALYSNSTGGDNVAVGVNSLFANTASENTALGKAALTSNTTGTQNVAAGGRAGDAITTGSQNTVIGYNAGGALTTPTFNAFFGRSSGSAMTTGSKNTIIGSYNGNQDGLDIRTSNNYVVLSDGDGNVRAYRRDDGDWYFVGNHTNGFGAIVENKASSGPNGLLVRHLNNSDDNGNKNFLECRDGTTTRMRVLNDGDVQNHDNSYGSISDQKVKEQIADASSQWDDIKALTVRKYKMKEDVANKGDSDALWRLGLVAQEVEAAGMSGLVIETPDVDEDNNDLGTTTKALKYSVLYMKAVKALQEAMTRIETLETKVAALEAE